MCLFMPLDASRMLLKVRGKHFLRYLCTGVHADRLCELVALCVFASSGLALPEEPESSSALRPFQSQFH